MAQQQGMQSGPIIEWRPSADILICEHFQPLNEKSGAAFSSLH